MHDELHTAPRERRHSNGAVAQITETVFLGFTSYRSMTYRVDADGALSHVRVEAGYQTAAEAQEAADRLAHPGCTGQGCTSWSEVGQILEDPPAEQPAADRESQQSAGGILTPKPST